MPITWLFDKLARKAGYVTRVEMQVAVATVVAEKDRLEGELKHKNKNLQNTIYLRDRLEREVEFLRQLELAHAREESGTQQAVAKMDAVAEKLLEYMRSVWPDANDFDPTQATEETRELAAV